MSFNDSRFKLPLGLGILLRFWWVNFVQVLCQMKMANFPARAHLANFFIAGSDLGGFLVSGFFPILGQQQPGLEIWKLKTITILIGMRFPVIYFFTSAMSLKSSSLPLEKRSESTACVSNLMASSCWPLAQSSLARWTNNSALSMRLTSPEGLSAFSMHV